MDDVPEIASKFHLERMINNRDYSVLINYNPPTRVFTSEHSNQTFSHDLFLLEIRAVLLSCIYYSAYMVKEFSAQNVKSTSSEVNGLNTDDKYLKLDELGLHLKRLKNLYLQLESKPPVPVPKCIFGSFFGSKLFGLEKSKNMLIIILNFIEFILMLGLDVRNNSAYSNDEWMNKLKTNASELTNGLEKVIVFCQCIISKTTIEVDSSLKLEGRKEVLEILTNTIDVSIIINKK